MEKLVTFRDVTISLVNESKISWSFSCFLSHHGWGFHKKPLSLVQPSAKWISCSRIWLMLSSWRTCWNKWDMEDEKVWSCLNIYRRKKRSGKEIPEVINIWILWHRARQDRNVSIFMIFLNKNCISLWRSFLIRRSVIYDILITLQFLLPGRLGQKR